MSKADEMFEELGYEYEEVYYSLDGSWIFTYSKNNDFIRFRTADKKMVTLYKTTFTNKELQAINEKVKELGWNEKI